MSLTTLSLEYKPTYDLMQMLANAKSPKMVSVLSTVLRGRGIVMSSYVRLSEKCLAID